MRKLFSIIAATLFATTMFATDVTVDLSKGKHDGSSITWTAVDENISIQQLKGTSSTAVNASYIAAPRVYKGHVLAFKCKENYTITGIEITCNGTYYGNSMTAGTVIKGDTLVTDDATNILRTWASTSGGTHVVTTKNTDGESTIYIQNVASAENKQLRPTAIKIAYIKAASTTPTISAANVDFGTVISGKAEAAKLNVTGENLTTAITYSLGSGANFSVSGTLTTDGGELTINVTNTAEGVYNDVLTLVSGTDATKEVTISAKVVQLTGEGTKEKPYTCADVLKLNNAIGDKAWVIGYILGGAKTAGSPTALVVDNLTGENTAIAIADVATETDNTKMVSVQLGQDVRAAVAATTSKGRAIEVQGTLEAYLTVPGVKGVNAAANYEFVDTPPTPGVIEITNSEDTYYSDLVDDEGYWIFEVETATYYLILSNDGTVTEAAGTYAVDDLDPEYTYLLTETDSVWFVSGSITLAVNGDEVTIKGDLVGKDGNTYRLDLSCAPNPYRYDEDANFTATFDSYEIDDTDFDSDGVILIEGNQDGKAVMIGMFLPATATEAVPVAGTYPINDKYQPQTVAAGYFDETEGLMPSVAAVVDGASAKNIWYLVSGNVTVNEYKTLTVVAKNSKNRDIAITLKGEDEPTSIANTKAANLKRKTIKNGLLYINANNVEYNVNGAIVK